MAETIFVVLHEDRHSDAEPYLFREQGAAVAKARELCTQHATFSDNIEEQELTDSMIEERWLFYATYSTEGDSVVVMERELQ